MTEQELADLKALEEKATALVPKLRDLAKGEADYVRAGLSCPVQTEADRVDDICQECADVLEALPALIKRVEELEGALNRLRRQVHSDAETATELLAQIASLQSRLATVERETVEKCAKVDLRLMIQKAISEIPANNPGMISMYPTALRDVVARRLIENIADLAAKAASQAIRALAPPVTTKDASDG